MIILKILGVLVAIYFLFTGTIGALVYVGRATEKKKTPFYFLIAGIVILITLIFV